MTTTNSAPLLGIAAETTGVSRRIDLALAIELARKVAAAMAITYVADLPAAEKTLAKIRPTNLHVFYISMRPNQRPQISTKMSSKLRFSIR